MRRILECGMTITLRANALLKRLKKACVICRVDKTTQNLCIMFKDILEELRSQSVYASKDENDVFTSEVDILDRHKTFMHDQGHKYVFINCRMRMLRSNAIKTPLVQDLLFGDLLAKIYCWFKNPIGCSLFPCFTCSPARK